jgi:hypothetical protein
MVLVVDEDEFVALVGIREADAARIARHAPIGDPANGTLRGQLLVREGEQMGEALRRQPSDTKAHDHSPWQFEPPLERDPRRLSFRFLLSNSPIPFPAATQGPGCLGVRTALD